MKHHVAFSTLLTLCIPCAVAYADTDPMAAPKDPRAAEHLKQGNRQYRLRDFQAAITAYKAGAAIEEAGVFWYNLGQSYRQLGNYDEALWYYQRFLDRAQPKGTLRESVVDFIQKMTAEKSASKQPPTDAGGDDGDATASGKKETPPLPANLNQTTAPKSPGSTAMNAQRSEQPAWYADGVGWALTGTGVIALGVGSGLLVSSSGLNDDAGTATTELARADLHDRADSRRRLGLVVAGVGGAVAACGIIKLILVPNRRETDPVLSAAPTSGGVAVMMSGRF